MSNTFPPIPWFPMRWLGILSRNVPYFPGKWRLIDLVFQKWQSRHPTAEVVTLEEGVSIYCKLDDEVQNNIWWLGNQYERAERMCMLRYLKPGMTFFDVGANAGYYTLLAAATVQRNGRVHAFEPLESMFAALTANVGQNQMSGVTVNRKIVSDRSGTMTIYHGDSNNSGSSSVIGGLRAAAVSEVVTAITLDDYCRESGVAVVDCMKIDVEGHELAVLRGAKSLLASCRPTLFVEVIDERLKVGGGSRKELFEFLATCGYRGYEILADSSERLLDQDRDGKLILFKHLG